MNTRNITNNDPQPWLPETKALRELFFCELRKAHENGAHGFDESGYWRELGCESCYADRLAMANLVEDLFAD